MGARQLGLQRLAQFLANRGYAVLQPNFRGSTGYGKKFLNAGNKQWGDKMQDDLTWGVKHLVAQGIADPKRVGIMGGSYGGYATLAGVAFTPDVYAAAVVIVGPSNLITLLDSIPPYWEAGRKIFHVRMGDPTTPEGKAQLERQSPLNSASKIKTPLLVVQGANDPRVKKARVGSDRDRAARPRLPGRVPRRAGRGPRLRRPVNNMAMFAASEKFLAKHLGGRVRRTMTPEVAARLKEITVDPKTVALAKKVDPAAVGAAEAAPPIWRPAPRPTRPRSRRRPDDSDGRHAARSRRQRRHRVVTGDARRRRRARRSTRRRSTRARSWSARARSSRDR